MWQVSRRAKAKSVKFMGCEPQRPTCDEEANGVLSFVFLKSLKIFLFLFFRTLSTPQVSITFIFLYRIIFVDNRKSKVWKMWTLIPLALSFQSLTTQAQHCCTPFGTSLVWGANFLHLLFSTTLVGWVFSCSQDKEAGAISCLTASDGRVLRGQWPAEPHKSNTCTHKDRERD